jgi:hypothetical protein
MKRAGIFLTLMSVMVTRSNMQDTLEEIEEL